MSKKKEPNPVENLDPVQVVDNTTTKSDRKSGASLVEQTTNEENEIKKENSKSFIFSQLNDYLFGFNENEETAKLLQAVEMGFITSEEIPAIIAKRKKSAIESANETTSEEFIKKLESFKRFFDLKMISGFAGWTNTEIIKAITENGKAVIYHSISESEINPDSKKATFGTKTAKDCDYFGNEYTVTVWVELAEITTENLVKAIRYYSVWDSANYRVNNATKRENKPVYSFKSAGRDLIAKGITKEQLITIIEEL